MIPGFFADVGKSLWDRFGDLVLSPALGFWGVGLLLWWWTRGGGAWGELHAWLAARAPLEQLLVAAMAVGLLAGSAALMQAITTPLIRLMEGYWPDRRVLNGLRRHLVARGRRRWMRLRDRWQRAASEEERHPPGPDRTLAQERRGALEIRLLAYPESSDDLMPTRLGNVLRAAERQPLHRYGLDPVATWWAFWLVLPETTQQVVARARDRLDRAAAAVAWAGLVLLWAPLHWMSVPVAVAATVVLSRTVLLSVARQYAHVLVAAYDVHRFELYRAMRLPLPTTSADEVESGTRLTELVWKGTTSRGDPVHLRPLEKAT